MKPIASELGLVGGLLAGLLTATLAPTAFLRAASPFTSPESPPLLPQESAPHSAQQSRAPAHAPTRTPKTASELLQLLAASPGVSAQFSEQKQIALLRAPLRSSGQLFYDPELGLVRKTEKPRPSTMYLNRQQLVIVDAKGRRDVDLKNHPSAHALVHSFLNVLRGDEQILQRDFDIRFDQNPLPPATPGSPAGSSEKPAAESDKRSDGSSSNEPAHESSDASAKGERPRYDWSLTLQPKAAQLKRLVRQVVFFGLGEQLTEMRVAETNGDRTTMQLSHLDAKRRFSAAEKKRLFLPPPK